MPLNKFSNPLLFRSTVPCDPSYAALSICKKKKKGKKRRKKEIKTLYNFFFFFVVVAFVCANASSNKSQKLKSRRDVSFFDEKLILIPRWFIRPVINHDPFFLVCFVSEIFRLFVLRKI